MLWFLDTGYQWYATNVLGFLDETYQLYGRHSVSYTFIASKGKKFKKKSSCDNIIITAMENTVLWICNLFHLLSTQLRQDISWYLDAAYQDCG